MPITLLLNFVKEVPKTKKDIFSFPLSLQHPLFLVCYPLQKYFSCKTGMISSSKIGPFSLQ